MSKCWIAVASAEHVRLGRAAGFMQVSHGKAAPLRRIQPGDRVAYYSPTNVFGGKDKLQSFTAIGVVRAGEPYQAEMGEGFRPFRRDVDWLDAKPAPIRPLLEKLAFTRVGPRWGYQFRFGLFAVSAADFQVIATAMGVKFPAQSAVMPGLDPGIHAGRRGKKKRGWPDQVRPRGMKKCGLGSHRHPCR